MERFVVILAMIVIFLGVYILVMSGYFLWRRRKPYQKYLPEITIVLSVVLLSIIVKAIILGFSADGAGDKFKPAFLILRSIYDALGGLAFEGLAFDLDNVERMQESAKVLVYSIYVGTTLFSSIVFLSITAAKASYEIYSSFVLIFSRISVKKKNGTYIFTGLTNETIQLALSIKANNPNARIIFSGDNLPSFDRHDKLCRDVMSNGFLYITINGNQHSIAKSLHLNRNNSRGRFVVFAFVSNNNIPEEEINMDIVVSDVKARIDESKSSTEIIDGLVIEYCILTKRSINYQAYQSTFKELGDYYYDVMNKKLTQDSKTAKEQCFEEPNRDIEKQDKERAFAKLKKYVSINVWNEANAIAGSMARFIKNYHDAEASFAIPDSKSTYVWSLGFGETAQALCKELYVQSACVDEHGNAATYMVDAFDPQAKDIDGILQYEEPMSIYINTEKLFDNATANEKKENLRKMYVDKQLQLLKANGESPSIDQLKEGWQKEFQPFVVNLHQMSCFGDEFLSYIDKFTGVVKRIKQAPQYIIVATGDDYRNIRLVNALVYDILNEDIDRGAKENKEESLSNKKSQVIFVNIWDKKNNGLLNVYDVGEKVEDSDDYQVIKYINGLYVVILGNNENIYSNSIISFSQYAKFNKFYQYATNFDDNENNEAAQIEEFFYAQKCGKVLDREKKAIINDYIHSNAKKIKEVVKDDELVNIGNSEWLDIDIWERKSNVTICNYSKTFPRILEKDGCALYDKVDEDKIANIYLQLLTQEHQRWMRLHCVHGWNYGCVNKSKNKARRLHNCIAPYLYIPKNTWRYDLFNIILSCVVEQQPEEESNN